MNCEELIGARATRLHEALYDPSVGVRTFMALIVDYSQTLVQLKMHVTANKGNDTRCPTRHVGRISYALSEPV